MRVRDLAFETVFIDAQYSLLLGRFEIFKIGTTRVTETCDTYTIYNRSDDVGK